MLGTLASAHSRHPFPDICYKPMSLSFMINDGLFSDGHVGELKQWLLWVNVCAWDGPLFQLAATMIFYGGKEHNMSGQLCNLKKIDHIAIVVQDLEMTKNFFLDLGFVVVKQGILEGEWIDKVVNLSQVQAEYVMLTIPQTETNIELLKFFTPGGAADPQMSMPNQIGFRHMALEVKNIESVVSDLKQKGVTFFSNIQVYNNQKKLCYFLGPEGIILELAEYQ